MNKYFNNILSGVAILIGLISLSVSLTSQGPTGESGSLGSQGPSGIPGEDGSTPYIGNNGNWWIGETDSGVSASGANASQIPLPNVDLAFSAHETQLYNETLEIPFSTPGEKLSYAQNLIATEGFVGISTASQLINMTDIDGKYVLLNDITFATNLLWSPINFNGTGTVDNYFSGILDGAGFSIADLHYQSIDFSQDFSNFGLFEGLNEATVRHLYLTNFNIFSINNDNRPAEGAGSLAGIAINSDIYNINMTNTLVSGSNFIGGLIGNIYDSSVRFITANLIRVWGEYNIGGLFGSTSNTELTNVNIKTILNGSNNFQGGVTGSSTNSFYAFIEVETEATSANTPLVNIRYDIGGMIGNSQHDRLFRVTTTGMIEFIPIDTNFVLVNVGGVIGYGNNIVLGYVENQTNITIYMDEIDYDVEIRSIGGVVGSVDHGTFNTVMNSGIVAIYPPENGLDTDFYLNAEETPVEYIGGIIGYVYGSVNLKYVVNSGLVMGIIEVGGIIGSTGIPIFNLQQLIVIDQSANFGSVGGYTLVGGLMGVSDVRTNLIVANFMNYGDINANYIVGGLFGIISPIQGIKVQIINSYNRGVVTALDYGVGGLIGGVAPEIPNFEFPVLGEVHIYNSFNVGLVRALNLGRSNVNFEDFSGGSIIGFRYILTFMYGVSFTPQVTSFLETTYDADTNNYIETGKIIDLDLPGVGNGNNTDMNMIHNPQYLFNADLFIYQTAWDFYTIWASEENRLDGLPYLQFLDSFLSNIL
jgi:hypothetical protein